MRMHACMHMQLLLLLTNIDQIAQLKHVALSGALLLVMLYGVTWLQGAQSNGDVRITQNPNDTLTKDSRCILMVSGIHSACANRFNSYAVDAACWQLV